MLLSYIPWTTLENSCCASPSRDSVYMAHCRPFAGRALSYSFPDRRETHHSNGPAATVHHRLLRLFPKVICHWDSSWPPPQLRDSPHPPLTKMRNVRHFPLSSVHGLRLCWKPELHRRAHPCLEKLVGSEGFPVCFLQLLTEGVKH